MSGDLTKNKGPLLTSFSTGGAGLIPNEWVAKIGTYQEDQKMPLGYVLNGAVGSSPVDLSDGLVLEQRLLQTLTDERKRTSVVLNPVVLGTGGPPPGGGPPGSPILVSEERIPNGQVATRTRTFVPEGTHLVLSDDMLTAEQRNLGLGALDQVVLQAPVPGPGIVDSKFDELGSIVTVVKTRKRVADIVPIERIDFVPTGPSAAPGVTPKVNRIKVTKEGETATVASQIVTTDTLPGRTLLSFRIEADGGLVSIAKTKKQLTTIAYGEFVNAAHTLWSKVGFEAESELVATEVVEMRVLPTPVVVSTRLEPDGLVTIVSKQKRHTADILTLEQLIDVNDPNPPHALIGRNWVKSSKEGESKLVATQVLEVRFLPISPVLGVIPSVAVSGEYQIVGTTKKVKRLADIVENAVVSGTTITTVESEALSDVVATEVVKTQAFTDKALYSRSTEIGLPGEYRSLVTVKTTENVVIGDSTHRAAMPTALATGEIEKSEQQIDNLLKRKGSKVIDTTAIPVTTTEELTTEYGGLRLNVTKTVAPLPAVVGGPLDIPNAYLTNYDVISDKVSSYGTFGIRETKVNQNSGVFALLKGTEIDQELNAPINFTQQVVAAGFLGSAGNGTSTEVRPLDAARSLKITRFGIESTFLEAYKMEMPGTTSIDLPPQLMSVKYFVSSRGGAAGGYANNGEYHLYNGGSGSISLRGNSHASAASALDVIPVIKQTLAQNIPCRNFLFLLASNVVNFDSAIGKLAGFVPGVQRWPSFRPEVVSIQCVSQKVSGEAQIDQNISDTVINDYLGTPTARGFSINNGKGAGFDVEVTTKTINIPPTIHGNVTITALDGTPLTTTAIANCSIVTQGYGFKTATTDTLSATASIKSPNPIPATAGRQTIPTNGWWLTRMRTEPYKFQYQKCFCEVVDAAFFA